MPHDCSEHRRVSRRSFLRCAGLGLGGLALADPLLRTIAATYAQSSGGSGNLLVLCQLDGGLDVLSFLAPFTNSVYRTKRPVLALPDDKITALPDHAEYGLNRDLPAFSELYAQGQLAIVQQVGYPDPNGSHFESQEIYEYGARDVSAADGVTWYERLRLSYFDKPFGVLDTRTIGDPSRYGYPDHTYHQAAQEAFGRLAKLKQGGTDTQKGVRSAYQTIDTRGAELRIATEKFESVGESRGEFYRAAKLASAGLGTRILKLSYGGFDTHGAQDTAQPELFQRLSEDFQQFIGDMKNLGLWERTCVCFYSEFGRRNEENGSPGTDHGAGGHIMLAGPRVRGGLHGQDVTSADLQEDSLPTYVDFRAVFGNCIQDWLGFDPAPVFHVKEESFDANVGSQLFR